jgi:radical SAM protein with 4Fe4S-binding SPASM domain
MFLSSLINGYILPGEVFYDAKVPRSFPGWKKLWTIPARAFRANASFFCITGRWVSASPRALPKFHDGLCDALRWYRKQLASTGASPSEEELRNCFHTIGSLFQEAWYEKEHGFYHQYAGLWKEIYFDSLMAESLLDWTNGSRIRSGLDFRIRREPWNCFSIDLSKRLGIFDAWANHYEKKLLDLLQHQLPDGGIPCILQNGNNGKGMSAIAPGAMAGILLEAECYLELKASTKLESHVDRGLNFLSSLPRLPHGESREIDVGIPDVMSASNLARLFIRSYARRRRRDDLEIAQEWASAALPFIVVIPEKQKEYGLAVIPALGVVRNISNGNHRNGFHPGGVRSWWNVSCPWIGLEVAETLVAIGNHDLQPEWRQIAEGLLSGALWMSRISGGLQHGIPDAFNLKRMKPEHDIWVIPRNFLRLIQLLRPEMIAEARRRKFNFNSGFKRRQPLWMQNPTSANNGSRAYPRHAYIDLIGYGNSAGGIYPHAGNKAPLQRESLMSAAVMDRVRRSLFPNTQTITFFAGGKALLNPQAKALLRDACHHGFQPIIISRGALLDDEVREILVYIGAYVQISLDDASLESLEAMRSSAEFIKVFDNVRKAAQKARTQKNPRFCLRFDAAISSSNIDDLPKIVDLAKEHGAEQVFFHQVYKDDIHRHAPDTDAYRERAAKKILEALSRGVQYGIHIGMPEMPTADTATLARIEQLRLQLPIDRMARLLPPHVTGGGFFCRAPYEDTVIKPDGNVAYCRLFDEGAHLGNLERQEFEDIWFGDEYRRLREAVNSEQPPEQCHPVRCGIRKPFWGEKLMSHGNRIFFTSLCPNRLAYLMEVFSVHLCADGAKETIVLELGVTNHGDTTWLNASDPSVEKSGAGCTRLGVWLFDREQNPLDYEFIRLDLSRNIPPEEGFRIELQIPGDKAHWKDHLYGIDLVCEGICWFSQQGQKPLILDGRQLLEAAGSQQ